ncbi:hypothetical protein A3E39_04380 [Candidatus Uhrbacteria bacterium RIFCSPHIGHO2_12_FULL_60_25]|uniref:Uncharacterized protein n=1 Tax=Candidatus Uhrbacteria bacterium RIFCSPHIGHO2_12_FULL_60_25 TaxID=1802399 RepID=A0A1F7UK73_9BACT|nr:MAG: hypothetical protein A3D73_00930 [Candidatus Uhrbacteria bacterium RIFCSPHIGHO2_02_FULL_60_44]OGL78124.1 MAG: hypothetical protein A3E39_04380 [Candidatus Uhrbacteria bacterium RIFCSPHIGHO2_12_FULL_60_25]
MDMATSGNATIVNVAQSAARGSPDAPLFCMLPVYHTLLRDFLQDGLNRLLLAFAEEFDRYLVPDLRVPDEGCE